MCSTNPLTTFFGETDQFPFRLQEDAAMPSTSAHQIMVIVPAQFSIAFLLPLRLGAC
jgi:hypothetical protein